MSYQERNVWSQLVGALVTLVVYLLLLPQYGTDGPGWLWAMLWAIGAGLAVAIVGSIAWNVLAGVRRGIDTRSDERDRQISHVADRVGQAFLVIAAVVAVVLCAVDPSPFWVAQTLFAGLMVSAFVGGVTSAVLYRTGVQ